MAMQKQLFTMNGLAVELGADRRTLAKYLEPVPPDGETRGGRPGWYLMTAIEALSETRTPAVRRTPAAATRSSDGPLALLVDRATDWQTIVDLRGSAGETVDIDVAAEWFNTTPAAVLVWLRAGAPFIEEGDWETGKGFRLRPAWLFDWWLLVLTVAKLTRDDAAKGALRL